MKPFALLAALALTGCLLDHERETRPGKVYKVDCAHIKAGEYDDPKPPVPGDTTVPCRVMEEP